MESRISHIWYSLLAFHLTVNTACEAGLWDLIYGLAGGGSTEEETTHQGPEEWLCCVPGLRGRGDETSESKMAAKLVINFHTLELEFREKSLFARITNTSNRVIQGAELATGLLPESKPEICHGDDFECVTFTWAKYGKLVIHHVAHETGIEYKMEWEHRKSGGTLRDVFLMESAHWYGAAQVRTQHWPIEKWSREETAYVTGDSFCDQYGGVMERYWLSSNGVAIFVDKEIPLFVGMNHNHDGKLTLASKWSSPYKNIKDEKAKLTYRIFIANNVKLVHELATNLSIAKPEAIPDERIFRYPIWSTWARYKKDINQQVVLDFAKEIKKNGFNAAQIEIDDDWTPRYGDNDFDETKFPNPKKLIDDIKDLGFRVTVWTHPFASPMSQASGGDYWIKSGFLPGHTTWWNGVGKILDVTKPDAVKFFKDSLKQLKEKYGIASFKFDAGETNWLPNFANPKNAWSNPNDYTTLYAKLCYECDTELRAQEVRVGASTQNLPIFVRMMDKDSKWGFENGLKSLIPHALTFSVIGYPFILPDMIGGNAYGKMGIGSSSELPEKELFIRWLQANTFLPAMQYSLCPWQYNDQDILSITKEMTELHANYSNYMIELAKECVRNGAPIIRPMWWLAPNDDKALCSDDQFLVGNDIVVAPIMVKGSTSRNIYLPPGEWNDMLRKRVLSGGKVYPNYEASLKELPYFTRVGVEFDFTLPAEGAAAPVAATSSGDASNPDVTKAAGAEFAGAGAAAAAPANAETTSQTTNGAQTATETPKPKIQETPSSTDPAQSFQESDTVPESANPEAASTGDGTAPTSASAPASAPAAAQPSAELPAPTLNTQTSAQPVEVPAPSAAQQYVESLVAQQNASQQAQVPPSAQPHAYDATAKQPTNSDADTQSQPNANAQSQRPTNTNATSDDA